MRTIRLLICAALLVGAMTASSGASQAADAAAEPRTSGPLLGGSGGCQKAAAAPGQPTFESCTWSYTLAADIDPSADYSALWMQLEIGPPKDACIVGVKVDIDAPSDGRIVSGVPADNSTISKTTAAVTELSVDGGGSGPMPGTIAQDVTLVRGKVKTKVTDERYSYKWTGKSKTPLMVAIGVQMSHAALPPALTYEQKGGVQAGFSSCEPMIVRVTNRA
jgi:hypothetical protein